MKYIYKIAYALFFVLGVLYMLLPIPITNQQGAYNTITKLYWCSDAYSCLHERVHQMDDQLGWISHSPEWENALNKYVVQMYKENTLTPQALLIIKRVIDYPSTYQQFITDEKAELYADIYALSNGNRDEMPDILEPYYLWDDAHE